MSEKREKFQVFLHGLVTTVAITDKSFEADEIIPGLYLGNASDACSVETNARFKRVVNLTTTVRNVFEAEHHQSFRDTYNASLDDVSVQRPLIGPLETLEYLSVRIIDKTESDISSHFEAMNAFIELGSCLVHCQAGVSRSATAVIAYLIYKGNTLDEACRLVKQKRPRINPNEGFWRQLISYNNRMNPEDKNDYSRI